MATPKQAVVCLGIAVPKAANHPVVLKTNYAAAVDRVEATLKKTGFQGDFLGWKSAYPIGCPTHQEAPFAFKAFCMLEALQQGYEQILWIDASIIVRRDVTPLFRLMAQRGYVICAEEHSVGEYCSDTALETLGISREESFRMPCCRGGLIGLDLRHDTARAFLTRWHGLSVDGRTFPGPKWSGVFGWPRTASTDPRVKGHRHDQTAASVIALQLGMDQWISKPDFELYFNIDRDFARTYQEEWHGVTTGNNGSLRLLRDSEIRRAAPQS